MEDAHTHTYEDVLSQFAVEPGRGLTMNQVTNSQEKYGPNGKCVGGGEGERERERESVCVCVYV